MKSSKGFGTGALWGELPARETFKQDVITPDIIENVWRQVMDDANSNDCDYQIDRQPDYVQLPVGNLHVLNTINFHQQLRTMEGGTVLTNLTTIEMQYSKEKKRESNSFQFLPLQEEKIALKNLSTVHHLTPELAHCLLKHAVVILLAHIGFENSSDIALQTLSDVADHFLKKMAFLLKVAVEQKDDGFPDAMERVLLEAGVGGVTAIHDYYQEYVLRFEENTKKKVEIMMEKQRRQLELNARSTKMILDETTSKLQFDELDEFGNVYREVPTLQLLDPEMGFPPSLDAGFQMLYSLEQDELNSLEVEEEEVNVSDSPPNTGRSDISIDKKK